MVPSDLKGEDVLGLIRRAGEGLIFLLGKRPSAPVHGKLCGNTWESSEVLMMASLVASNVQNRGIASKESHIPPKGGWPFTFNEWFCNKWDKLKKIT